MKNLSKYWTKLVKWLGFLSILSGVFWTVWRLIKSLNENPKTNLHLLLGKYRNLRKILIAQARHETGDFTSRAYHENHNLFGMGNANVRKQLGYKGLDQYRHYKNNDQSIRDMLLYLDSVNMPTDLSVQEYVTALNNLGYFTAPFYEYFEGVKHYYK
ncbi:MAG: glucosaminidase domain-containing protein [Gillisia sp.]